MTTSSFASVQLNETGKILAALPLSAAVTLALLFGMYSLIRIPQDVPAQPRSLPPIVDVVMKDIPPIENLTEKPERPRPIEAKPAMPKQEKLTTIDVQEVIALPKTIVEVPPVDGAIYASNQLLPFMKIQPNYPTRAAERGIEGYVEVMFDVTETGSTDNIRVVQAEPANIFNSSVIQAVKRWKYKPKLVDGRPVRTENLREKISFNLE